MIFKNSDDRLLIMCLILPVLAYLAFGLHGFCDTDQGFIQALAWRIYQGEIPYQDFIYVRPPLTIYLHSLTLFIFPHSWVLAIERFLFYLMMGLSVYWSTRSLTSFFDFKEIGLSPGVFALMAFILSVHNFPPMPWHTVDGIFFASLGMSCLSRGKGRFPYTLGLIAFFLAALSKQAFYPLLLAGPVLLWILAGRKKALSSLGICLLVFLIPLVVLLIMNPRLPVLFWTQTTGSTSLEGLLEAGLYRYLKPMLIVIPLLIVWRAHSLYHKIPPLPGLVFGLVFLVLLSLHPLHSLRFDEYIGPSYGFSQVFFLLATGIVLKGIWLNPRAFSLLLTMLIISWCTGISWGYANNMLYFTPILFGFLYGLYEEFNFTVPRYFFSFVVIFFAWVFGTLYQFPYRDAPRDEIYRSPAEIFPQFTMIYTGDYFFNKTQELSFLQQKYGANFTVLPAYPMANFLTGTQNPLPADWAHNAEMNYSKTRERIIATLKVKAMYILVEKDKKEEARNAGPYGSLLTGYILDNWVRVDAGNYFEVYRPTR